MWKQWVRVWAIGFVVWTVLAVLSATGAHLYMASVGSPEGWGQVLAWSVTVAFIWSLLTPVVYELARRFPFDRNSWTTALPIHLVACRRAFGGWLRGHCSARSGGDVDARKTRSLPGAHALRVSSWTFNATGTSF